MLSSLFDLIKAIIKKLVTLIKKIFKKLWPVLLLIALIYFAPVLGVWFTTNGFATLGTFFTTVGTTVTPTLVKIGTAVGEAAGATASAATEAFAGLSTSTQLAVVTGAAAIIAPEETASLVGDIIDAGFSLGGAALGAVFSNPTVLFGAAAFAFWFFFLRKKKGDTTVVIPEDPYNEELNQYG